MIEIKKEVFTKPLIIAGPCSAEIQEQLLTTAKGLEDKATIFRAGVWKPRTRPNSFEGVGQKALEWLKVVKHKTSLKVATEVANAQHVEACLKSLLVSIDPHNTLIEDFGGISWSYNCLWSKR